MSEASQIGSTPAPSQKRETRWWEFYVISVLAFGAMYHAVWYRLFGGALAIGDSTDGISSSLQVLVVGILNFPMMYLWFPLGEWLKPYITDDGVISLFAKINSLVWGILLTWALSSILRRTYRRHV